VVFWTVVPSPSWPYSLLPQAQRASDRGAGVGVGGVWGGESIPNPGGKKLSVHTKRSSKDSVAE